MRMRELVERTGVPRTAIHHYQREGLLPPAEKTAPNAALYGPEHVERLKLISALRGEELGPLPLDGIRQVVEMIESGVEPEVAAALCSLPGGFAGTGTGRKRSLTSLSEVARAAGVSHSLARALHASGLLLGRAEAGGSRVFDEADAGAAQLIGELLSHEEIRASDLDPIAELMGELVRYEKVLANLVTSKLSDTEAVERRAALHRQLHALHTYLFRRLVAEEAGWAT